MLDDVLIGPLGKEVLNFESPKAYQFFVEAKDTHKTWQAVQVLLFGTTLELTREYKIVTSADEGDPLGFLNWVSSHENATIKLVSNLLFSYVLAIYRFKIGVRNNESKVHV